MLTGRLFFGRVHKLAEGTISFVIFVCLSVCLSVCNISVPTGSIVTKFYVSVFL